MSTRPRRLQLCLPLLAILALGSVPGCQQKPAEAPDEGNADATAAAIKELEASGLLVDDARSPASLQAIMRAAETQARASVDRQLDHFGKLDHLRDHDAIRELGQLRELGAFELFGDFGLEIESFMPDATGGASGSSGSLADPFGLGDPTGCYLCASFPSQGSFAAFTLRGLGERAPGEADYEYSWRLNTQEGNDAGDGSSSTFYTEWNDKGAVTAEGMIWENADGTSLEARTEYREDGTVVVTTTDRDANGEVTHSESDKVPPPASTPPKPADDTGGKPDPVDGPKPGDKLDQYQPADGEGGGGCPLFLDYCRRVAERISGGRYALLRGSARVKPPPPGDETGNAPRLVVDRNGLVINPDPNDAQPPDATGTRQFELALPVFVLPPRPGSGAGDDG